MEKTLEKLKNGEPVTIVALGDSITEVTFHTRARMNWVGLLDEAIFETYGNGPQVGNLMLQRDLTNDKVPPMPLDIFVAQTEGSLGYILQDELLNHLRAHRTGKYVVTMITQVRVDHSDPAFKNPTKPVGPFYSASESSQLLADNPDRN